MSYRKSFAPYTGTWRKAYDKAKAQKLERKNETLGKLANIFAQLCPKCEKPRTDCVCANRSQS